MYFKVLTCSFMASRLAFFFFLRSTLSTSRQVDKNMKKTEKYQKQTIQKESYDWYEDICALCLCLYLSLGEYKYPDFPTSAWCLPMRHIRPKNNYYDQENNNKAVYNYDIFDIRTLICCISKCMEV